MDFDTFLKNCSFDIQPKGDETEIFVIFSQGLIKSFGKDFVDMNEDLTKKLAAVDLYDYLNSEFSNG